MQKTSKLLENVLKFPGDDKAYDFNVNDFINRRQVGFGINEVVAYNFPPKNIEVVVKIIPYPLDDSKEIKEKEFKRILEEIKNLSILNHCSDIVDYYGVVDVKKDKQFWIVMKRMSMSLYGLLINIRSLNAYFPEYLLGCIVVSITDALSYCHMKKVMHRDVKPQNILIGYDGAIQLADFGASRIMELRLSQTPIGTLAYMAPEMVKRNKYTHQADFFSFGMMFITCMNGKHPCPDVKNIAILLKWLKSFDINKMEEIITQSFNQNSYSNNLKTFLECCLRPVKTRIKSCWELMELDFYIIYSNIETWERQKYVKGIISV